MYRLYVTARVYNIMEVAELFARLCCYIREVTVCDNLAALYSSELDPFYNLSVRKTSDIWC